MTGVFDVDFVPQVATRALVSEHLSDGWREHLATGGGLAGVGYTLPAPPYRLAPAPPGDPVDRARELLDTRGVTRAIVNPGNAPGLSGISNAVMAAELARATNDWALERWPAADRRLAVAAVVAPRDGRLAADEVRRLAGDARVAAVVLAFPPVLLGDRSLLPLHEAAAQAGLPILMQAGGGFAGANSGPTPVGHPTTLWEYRIAGAYTAIGHLASIVSEGVFARFPDLRLVLSGFGIGWLRSLLWRMDADFEAAAPADRPPRLDRLPSDVVREHVSFTTVALERPPDTALLPAKDLLMFGSGDDPEPRPWPLDAFDAAITNDNAQRRFQERHHAT